MSQEQKKQPARKTVASLVDKGPEAKDDLKDIDVFVPRVKEVRISRTGETLRISAPPLLFYIEMIQDFRGILDSLPDKFKGLDYWGGISDRKVIFDLITSKPFRQFIGQAIGKLLGRDEKWILSSCGLLGFSRIVTAVIEVSGIKEIVENFQLAGKMLKEEKLSSKT